MKRRRKKPTRTRRNLNVHVEKNLPKPSIEVVKEFDQLREKLNDLYYDDDEFYTVSDRMWELTKQYDWFNYVFTDPATGKKGLMAVSGEIIVPALYDEVYEYHSYLNDPHAPVVATINGKYGILRGDGRGRQLCEFKFDAIRSIPATSLFLARWGDEKERFGLINVRGEVICPTILTGYANKPFIDVMTIQSGDKVGIIDTETNRCVLPEYDNLYFDKNNYVIFIKGDQKGYVSKEGEYVTLEQYKADKKKYEGVYFFCTS